MIRISIKGTGIELTPAIDEYVRKRTLNFEKLISSEDSSSYLAVEVGKETEHHKSGDIFFAEFNLHIAGHDFRARRGGGDINSAVDIAKDELMDAVRAHKGKQSTMLRRGSQAVKDMLRGFPWRRRRSK